MKRLAIRLALVLSFGSITLPTLAAPEEQPSAAPVSSPPASDPSAPQSAEVAELERKLHERINQVRKEQGLEPLVANGALTRRARAHSFDMARRGYFEHTSPDGETYFDRLSRAGLRYFAAGENIFMTSGWQQNDLLDRVVQRWMKSPGHRGNIVNPAYTDSGIGIWRNGKATYLTQDFLRPR